MQEPGLDRHEWETRWEELEPAVRDSPREALSELDDLVAQMLMERGFAIDDPVASAGDEPEVLTDFRAARDITRRIEAGLDDDPGDIAAAIENYREVYAFLIAERSAP